MYKIALALALFIAAEKGPALPAAANAVLRASLGTDEARLDGRLVLSEALLEEGTVRVTYTSPPGSTEAVAGAGITVVLGHPTRRPDGVKAGPFVILSTEGEDEPAVAALVTRLARLSHGQIWEAAAAGDEGIAAEAPAVVAAREAATRRSALGIRAVDLAIMVGDSDAAGAALDGLLKTPDLPASVLLDAVERYHRIKRSDAAKVTLDRWRQETLNDITDPIEAGRAEVLGGGEISALKVLQNARVSGERCGFERLAGSMDAMGHRTEGYLLLDTAARKTNCPDVEATMLEWFVADGRSQEAAELSGILMGVDGSNPKVVSVRADLLLAAEQYQAVVELLEPLVSRDLKGPLLGAYLEGRLALISNEGELAAIGEQSDANIADTRLSLIASAAYQRAGQISVARRYLERMSGVLTGHPVDGLLRVRVAFDRGDRVTATQLLDRVMAETLLDLRSAVAAEALRGELLRWTDHAASREALRRAMLLAARQVQGGASLTPRLKAQIAALDGCIEDGSRPPCEGPFLHPHDHSGNLELDAAGGSGFGNGLTIFGVLLLFLVIVRQGRMNRRRPASRWK